MTKDHDTSAPHVFRLGDRVLAQSRHGFGWEGKITEIGQGGNLYYVLPDGLNRCGHYFEPAEVTLVSETPFPPDVMLLQLRVGNWTRECFGDEIACDMLERMDRFTEEALELVQSLGYSADRAHALVKYVFGRPAGDPFQETGGTMTTLAAMCNVAEIDIAAAFAAEVNRIIKPEMVAKIRAKQAAKPTGSALPIAEEPPIAPHPDDEAVDRWAVAMKAKLAAARTKGRHGWDDPMRSSPEQLTLMLREHIEKGDPLDVANFAMMIHQRGLRILPPSRWADECLARSIEVLERHKDDELDRIPESVDYSESVSTVLGELQNRLRQDIRRPDRVRHLKSGGIYEVLGTARIQTSHDQPLGDHDRVVLYRSAYRGDRPYTGGELRGDLWARREEEFHDGRFEPVEGEAE